MTRQDASAPPSGRTLRERHRETTRTTILRALADIVSEGDVHGFTVQEVADRAGVSHRTVYRHFPSREALLEALAEWLDEELGRRGTPVLPRTFDELPRAAEVVFALFDEYAPMVRALAITYAATGLRPPGREARNEAFRRVIDEEAPTLDENERRRFYAVVRSLTNSQAWTYFHDQLGMTGEEAGRAVAWAVRVLSAEIRALERAAAGGDGSGSGAATEASPTDEAHQVEGGSTP